MSTTMLKRDLGTGDLCDNIGLVGVSAKWSYVTASPSHHDQAIPILSPLLFMHVGHPYIPLFKIRRIFDLLVSVAAMGICVAGMCCGNGGHVSVAEMGSMCCKNGGYNYKI